MVEASNCVHQSQMVPSGFQEAHSMSMYELETGYDEACVGQVLLQVGDVISSICEKPVEVVVTNLR